MGCSNSNLKDGISEKEATRNHPVATENCGSKELIPQAQNQPLSQSKTHQETSESEIVLSDPSNLSTTDFLESLPVDAGSNSKGKDINAALLAKRVQDFLEGKLTPYGDSSQGTAAQKATRFMKGVVAGAKALPIAHTLDLAVNEAASRLRNIGLPVLPILGMKEDLLLAMNLMSQIVDGMVVNHRDVSATTVACYYHMAFMRSLRGNDPELELKQHSGMPAVDEAEITQILRYASLPLSFIYEENASQIEQLGKTQGWTSVYISINSAIEKPVFSIFVQQENKECALCIRGTGSLKDCVTDIRGDLVQFPSEAWKQQFSETFQRSVDVSFLAHKGMSSSAEWIFWQSYETIQTMHQNGYKILILGHSLGAACAALSSVLFEYIIGEGKIQVYAFATPCCCHAELAHKLESSTISVVLRDDIVPRATPNSMRAALQEVLTPERKETYKVYFREDMMAAKKKTLANWVPVGKNHQTEDQTNTDAKNDKIPEEIAQEDNGLNLDNIDVVPAKLTEKEIPHSYVPGRIIHIYKYLGVSKACWVPQDFAPIRNVGLFDNLLDDHRASNILEMLCEARDAHRSLEKPAEWVSFSSTNVCMICSNDFTWKSTSSSEAQRHRDKYNCRRCGRLICRECSLNSKPIPSFGLLKNQRVCDICFHDNSIFW